MTTGQVIARHWLSRETVRAEFTDGMITALKPLPKADPVEWWIAPGLVDLQVNGFAGVDFQAENLDRGALEYAVRSIHLAGCARFMLTLVTDHWHRMMDRLTRLRRIRSESPLLEHAVAGWHVEGPFLSSKSGFYGAHDPTCLIDPTPAHIHQLRAVTGADPVILTVAPERKGAIDAIELAVSLGMKVSLGHTDAPVAVLTHAVRAGATGFTHLGNGCPPLWDRHDNITWRALDTTGLTPTLIPDGVHVSPVLFRIVHRSALARSILYVSDAMAAADMPSGHYRLREIEIDVDTDGVVRMPGTSQYAGSSLRPVDGVSRAAAMLGCCWQDAWRRYSQLPADWAGLGALFAVGGAADFCLIKTTTAGKIDTYRTFVAGKEFSR